MTSFFKLVFLMLLLAPVTFCNAKGWFDWFSADNTGTVKKKRLSVIPGVLRDQIASMEKEVDQLAHDSKERAQLLFRIDQRRRQIDNIKLIARGMPVDEFDEFVKLDDEAAMLRMLLRPRAKDESALQADPKHARLVALTTQLDATRDRYGLLVRKGHQPAEVIRNFHRRHMSEEVVAEVQRLREEILVEPDEDKLRELRNELHDLYMRSRNRKPSTDEELETIDAETAKLETELDMVTSYLEQAVKRDDDRAIELGRAKLQKIKGILDQSVIQRVLTLRKNRDLELMAERIKESGPPS